MKQLTLIACALLAGLLAKAQSITSFEVTTRPAYAETPPELALSYDSAAVWLANLPDTATCQAEFTLAINQPGNVTALQLALTNSGGTQVYANNSSLSTWQSSHAWRLQDNVLYLTINAGLYPNLKQFKALATVTYSGGDLTREYNR